MWAPPSGFLITAPKFAAQDDMSASVATKPLPKNNMSQDMCRLGLVCMYAFEDSQNRDSAIL